MGTIINHSNPVDTWTANEKQDLQQQYLAAYPGISPTYYTHLNLSVEELLPTRCYNCWGFTFDPRQCWISSGNDVQNILDHNGVSVPEGDIKPGDVICYRYNGGITHTGRVWSVDETGHASLIRSKWGSLGEYLHPPDLVPSVYGTDLSYWRCTHLQGRARLFIKDSINDDSYQYSPSPFWVSPDIWVDNDLDGSPDDSPIAGRTNHLYAKIRNVGTVPISNVEIRFYWADPSGGIPPSDWNLIGTYVIANLNALSDITTGPVTWIPERTPQHQCLLVIANGGDSIVVSGEPDPIVYPFNVRWENSIGMKNVFVINLSSLRPLVVSFFAQLKAFGFLRKLPELVDIDIELVHHVVDDFEKAKDFGTVIKKEERYNIPLIKPFIPKKFIESGIKMDLELPMKVGFKNLDSKSIFKRSIKNIKLLPKEKVQINIKLEAPEDIRIGSKYILNIIQKADGIITGGITYHINIVK